MTTFGWIMLGVTAALWLLELRRPSLWEELRERSLDRGEADQGSPGPPTSPLSSDREDDVARSAQQLAIDLGDRAVAWRFR